MNSRKKKGSPSDLVPCHADAVPPILSRYHIVHAYIHLAPHVMVLTNIDNKYINKWTYRKKGKGKKQDNRTNDARPATFGSFSPRIKHLHISWLHYMIPFRRNLRKKSENSSTPPFSSGRGRQIRGHKYVGTHVVRSNYKVDS